MAKAARSEAERKAHIDGASRAVGEIRAEFIVVDEDGRVVVGGCNCGLGSVSSAAMVVALSSMLGLDSLESVVWLNWLSDILRKFFELMHVFAGGFCVVPLDNDGLEGGIVVDNDRDKDKEGLEEQVAVRGESEELADRALPGVAGGL